jgi:hypothetical protein
MAHAVRRGSPGQARGREADRRAATRKAPVPIEAVLGRRRRLGAATEQVYKPLGAVRAALGRRNLVVRGVMLATTDIGILDYVVGEPVTYVQALRC